MTTPPLPAQGESDELIEVAWTLVAYARSTWAARYSKRHYMAEGDTRTLCGIAPPVHTPNGHNYEGSCRRCQSSPRYQR